MEQVGKEMPDVVGVDGCKAGWFAVRLYGQGQYETKAFGKFNGLIDYYHHADLILVDIPIGLPEKDEGRKCDPLARSRVGPRRSSVFPTPTRRTMLQVKQHPRDYPTARNVELCSSGKGLLKQTFEITGKIAEVDEVVQSKMSTSAPGIREIHPELCFWALGNQQTLSFHKSRPLGFKERLGVLQSIEGCTKEILEYALSRHWQDLIAKNLMEDDILDALAAAVTGYYGYHALQTLPPSPPHDAKGLPMEMVYWVPPET